MRMLIAKVTGRWVCFRHLGLFWWEIPPREIFACMVERDKPPWCGEDFPWLFGDFMMLCLSIVYKHYPRLCCISQRTSAFAHTYLSCSIDEIRNSSNNIPMCEWFSMTPRLVKQIMSTGHDWQIYNNICVNQQRKCNTLSYLSNFFSATSKTWQNRPCEKLSQGILLRIWNKNSATELSIHLNLIVSQFLQEVVNIICSFSLSELDDVLRITHSWDE